MISKYVYFYRLNERGYNMIVIGAEFIKYFKQVSEVLLTRVSVYIFI